MRPGLKYCGVQQQDEPGETLLYLEEADDTEEEAGFLMFVQLGDALWCGRFLGVFGKYAGVEKPSSSLEVTTGVAAAGKVEVLNGEAGGSRAVESLPCCLMSRAYSSAETTAAVGFTCLATV